MSALGAAALATGVAAAAVGGVYAAFSVMVMPALRRLDAPAAVAVMQEVNVRAERGPFIALFAGGALAAVALGTLALRAPGTDPRHVVAAALLLGSVAVTVVGNVPLNQRLASEGAEAWPHYAEVWTRLNTLRTLLALGAVGALVR
ncbi:anthrone oxygenase family protein [Nocardioides sp. CPCC 205120]|uniref:anthrone oxygenase family protein n=1 Tax=Nocardioides sp. CPCC 205120 TaxID=3406462 RepID=UPI003B50130E